MENFGNRTTKRIEKVPEEAREEDGELTPVNGNERETKMKKLRR